MKPWQLGDGDNTVATEQLRMEFIFDSINRQLQSIGVTEQTTFDAFANYIGYSTGGTPSYQDMQVAWTPTNAKLGQSVGVFTFGDLGIPNCAMVLDQITIRAGIDLEVASDIVSVSAPNLTGIDPLNTQAGFLSLRTLPNLISFSFPVLTTVAGDLNCSQCTNVTIGDFSSLVSANRITLTDTKLASLDMSSFVTCVGDFAVGNNPLLVSIDISSFLPTPGTAVGASGNALNTATVDMFLARCVAVPTWGNAVELLALNGGTNSAPSSVAPGSDYATLIARGANVLVNP